MLHGGVDDLVRTSRRVWIAALPGAGPVGLAVYILAGVSLPLAVAAVAVGGGIGWALLLRRLPSGAVELRRRVTQGAIAGLAATAAYDATRYGTVAIVHLSFRPFHVWTIFGRLLVGDHHALGLTVVAGALFHVANGVGLGISFRLIFVRPTTSAGIAWAFALELAMALLYPAWLRPTAFGEFLSVSALGHGIYGASLAWACERLDRSSRHGVPHRLGSAR